GRTCARSLQAVGHGYEAKETLRLHYPARAAERKRLRLAPARRETGQAPSLPRSLAPSFARSLVPSFPNGVWERGRPRTPDSLHLAPHMIDEPVPRDNLLCAGAHVLDRHRPRGDLRFTGDHRQRNAVVAGI